MIYRDTDIAAALRARSAGSRRMSPRGGRRGASSGGVAGPFDFNSISGLVTDLDARDKTAGAITDWTDRKFGDVFTGTATRGTAINSLPSVTFNGSSDILAKSGGNYVRLSGATALTMVGSFVDTASATAAILELGAFASAGSWLWYCTTTQVISSSLGDVGTTAGAVTDTLATAAVWSVRLDYGLSTNENGNIRKNGTAQSVTNSPNSNNSGSFLASTTFAIGARVGPSIPWAGSTNKIVIYSRALSDGETQQAERAVGVLSGISVA